MPAKISQNPPSNRAGGFFLVHGVVCILGAIPYVLFHTGNIAESFGAGAGLIVLSVLNILLAFWDLFVMLIRFEPGHDSIYIPVMWAGAFALLAVAAFVVGLNIKNTKIMYGAFFLTSGSLLASSYFDLQQLIGAK